jgi:uncharacterized protein YjbI with pentapeptide repeats
MVDVKKEPNPRELRRLKWQLRRRRLLERLGSTLGFKGKTVWNLLQLLIVPALLAYFALWFNDQASIRENERNIAQRELELEANRLQKAFEQSLAEDRSREEALQSYLDGFGDLLLDWHLRTSEPDAEVRSVARARTLTVLRGLDGERKGALLKFLYESRLIDMDTVVINLTGADLRGADMALTDLTETDLSYADLSGAILREANLYRANFTGAILREANLRGAFLNGADLEGAKVTQEQLDQAGSLEGAIMPDGSIHE